ARPWRRRILAPTALEQLVQVREDAAQPGAAPEAAGAQQAELPREAREERATVERAVGGGHEQVEVPAIRVPPQVRAAAELAGHVFDLDHLPQAREAVRAADPAVLHAAPGGGRLAVAVHAVVDGHDTGLQAVLQAAGGLLVPRPGAGREAVRAVVREA